MATRQSLTASFRVAYAAEDGEDACILALSNESEMVACDGLGNVTDVSTIEGTTWTFYVGNTAIDASEYTYSVKATGCSVEYSVDGSTGTVAVGAMSEDTATVEIEVTYDGTTYSRTYTLTKNKANISYALVVNPGVLAYDADGNYTGGAISIGVRVIDNGVATIYTDLSASGEAYTTYRLFVYRSARDSGSYTLMRYTSGTYTPSDTVAANYLSASGCTISLFLGTSSSGTLVDQETLEVVQNGANGSDGQDGQDGTSVKIAGKAHYHFETWAAAYSYTVGFTDTDVTILCDETGDLSDGTTATGTGAYVHAVDEDGNYTVTLATEGDCYVVNNDAAADAGDNGHIWYATADVWEDLGQLAGSDGDDAEFYELRDAATYSGNYASAVTAAIGSVASDGTITENIAYALYVVLAHVVGDTTSYVASSSATVTANVIVTETTTDEDTGEETITSGWQDVNFTRNGAVYYYTGTFSGVDLSDLPASIRVTATYGGNTYYLTVPVTLATDSYFSVSEKFFSSVYQNSESIATLTATADTIQATVESTYSKAGLTITDDTIVLTASQTYIKDGDGNTIALFSDGKVSADLIDAESIFTAYLSATNAVLGNVTIEGSIVYAQHVLNKGTESTYLEDYTDSGSATFDGVTAQTLDVCTIDGTLVVEEDTSFVLPYIDVDDNKVVNSFVRGKTQFNSSTWREMSFSDFRRLLGRELTIINNSCASYIKIGLGDRYFIGDDTTPTELTDGIYSLYTGRTVTFAIDYSTEYGYLWRASEASYGSDGSVLPEDVMALAGYYWDLPTTDFTAGEGYWQEDGTLGGGSTSFLCPSACIGVPANTTTASIQTCATKTINGTTYHYTIYNIYAGTAGDSAASYLTDVTTLLADGDTALTGTGTGTLKLGGDGTVYRADVNVEGYDYIVVSFRVFTETASGGTSTSGYDGLTAETAVLGTNIELSNLKILFY